MNWLSIKNLAEKIVELNIEGVIGGSWFTDSSVTMEQVNKDLKDLKAIEADTIKINIINSPGGSVLHGLGIIDILNGLSAKKEVNILGMAASMAAVIAMVAKTEDRSMTENSFFLIHRLKGSSYGTIKQVESDIEFWKKNEQKLTDILISGTGKDKTFIENMMDENEGNGIFYTAQESLDNGMIGAIAGKEPTSMAAFVENVKYLPALPKNLLKVGPTFDSENLIKKIVAKVTEIFTNKNSKMEKTEVEAIVKAQVDAFKEILNTEKAEKEATDILAKKDAEIKALNEKLAIEKLRNGAGQTEVEGSTDPNILDPAKATIGKELLKNMSFSQRNKLQSVKK